jgi:integrase
MTIPREIAKNGVGHKVPLSPLVLDLFRQLHAITVKRLHVLPHAWGSKYPDRCVSEAALSKAMRRNQKLFGLPRFTTHDLRRTASTTMAKLKIPRLHIEKCSTTRCTTS